MHAIQWQHKKGERLFFPQPEALPPLPQSEGKKWQNSAISGKLFDFLPLRNIFCPLYAPTKCFLVSPLSIQTYCLLVPTIALWTWVKSHLDFDVNFSTHNSSVENIYATLSLLCPTFAHFTCWYIPYMQQQIAFWTHKMKSNLSLPQRLYECLFNQAFQFWHIQKIYLKHEMKSWNLNPNINLIIGYHLIQQLIWNG